MSNGKTKWEEIEANNSVERFTDKAALVGIPKTDYKFWHPKKLVKTFGKNNYGMAIAVCPEMKFKIFKNGQGQWNKFEKIDEREIDLRQLKELFADSIRHFQQRKA